jgi:hypothetical protein
MGRFVQLNLAVEIDSQFEDPKEFLDRVKVAINEGDEDVRIVVAGHETHVEILAVGT